MKGPGHLRIEQVKLLPGEEWIDESRAWRFVRLTAGAAYWLDPVRPRAFTAGELLVLAPLAKAVVRASQLNEVVLEGFTFAPDLLYGFLTLAERHAFEPGGTNCREPFQFLPSTHYLTEKFGLVASHAQKLQPALQRTELLGLALHYLCDRLPSPKPSPATGASVQDRLEQIVAGMPDMEIIQHTPDQLAALCGCSSRHFNRLFRKRFGQSPRERQTELRLLKARQLLGASHETIAQVALDSGYRSVSLFNSLFKRRFGMSPSGWRQQVAREQTVDSSFRT